jgi:hypothetical protein
MASAESVRISNRSGRSKKSRWVNHGLEAFSDAVMAVIVRIRFAMFSGRGPSGGIGGSMVDGVERPSPSLSRSQ